MSKLKNFTFKFKKSEHNKKKFLLCVVKFKSDNDTIKIKDIVEALMYIDQDKLKESFNSIGVSIIHNGICLGDLTLDTYKETINSKI